MLDAIAQFISEVVAFHLGRFYIFIFTLGQVKVNTNSPSQPLISLFGGMLTLAIIVSVGIWLNN
jgi:hypothetical protein